MPYFPLQNTPILILFLLALLSLCSLAHLCPNTTTFTPNSTFQNNRDQLLSSLVSNATRVTGFYQTSAGGTDTKKVVLWYHECMVRYSTQSFLPIASREQGIFILNTANVTQLTGLTGAPVLQFNQTLEQTMDVLVPKVINAALKFATQEANITRLVTLYTAGQCTQDLSTVYPFYKSQVIKADSPPPSPASIANHPPTTGKSKLSFIVIPSILAPVALCVLVVVVARCFIHKSKRAKQQQNKVDMTTVESLQFDLGTVEAATKKFSGDNKLGEGGFGQVFKGTLDNGQEIAVKRLSKSSGQGVREFKNEVLLVAKLQHRNLVRLLGFCLEGEETLLVYEYVPNKSLDYFLFQAEKREQLDWSRR
ncbi:hypothetical protein ACLB2K_033187 [Fragaria x ananassa]